MKSAIVVTAALLAALAPIPRETGPVAAAVPSAQEALEGVWELHTYHLAAGPSHPLRGHIFFTAPYWQVLYFVLDETGDPRRGSGEGGIYRFDGERLVFFHRLNLSYGTDLPGLPAVGPRLVARETVAAEGEAAHARIDGDSLRIDFPSGNSIELRRAS